MGHPSRDLVTEKLRLRPLAADDVDAMATLGADERVMATFGGAATRETSEAWLERQLAHWRDHGFGRFFVSAGGVFVGLVGLSRADFDAGIVPGVEIAWRLVFEHWGRGYATEAARAVIQDGFERLGLAYIVGVTKPDNLRSRRVMDRLGMLHSPSETFEHPLAAPGANRVHVVYRLSREAHRAAARIRADENDRK